MSREEAPTFRRILIFKPGAIGDLLHLTPVIRALAERWPGAGISLILNSPLTASLFAANPLVTRVIRFDQRGRHRSPAALFGLWRELRRERYDLVLNFQRSNLKGWLLLSAAMPARLLVYHKARGRTIHAVVNHLETLAPLGIAPTDVSHHLDFPVGADAVTYADAFFARHGLEGRPVVAFNPGTSNPVKCWPAASFADLGDRLMAAGVAVVVLGSPAERALCDEVAAGMARPPVAEAGATLPQLAALLSRCAALVTGDTGPMHIAAAAGTRVVGLFGSMDPARSGPVGEGHIRIRNLSLPCVPCNSTKSCTNPRFRECMDSIRAAEVADAVLSIVAPCVTRHP